MIFPVGDENIIGGSKPFVSYSLIAINVLVFIYMLSLGDGVNDFYLSYATIPVEILQGNDYYTLLSNTFLHGGIMHIAGNMLFLWIFSDNIEAVMGNTRFTLFYLAGGIIASLAHVLFNQSSGIPALGASGAMSAVMGAYLVFFPQSKVKVLVIFLFKNVNISALYFLGAWFAMQLYYSLSSFGGDPNKAGTAWMAHIGGFVFGAAIAFMLTKLDIIDPKDFQTKKA